MYTFIRKIVKKNTIRTNELCQNNIKKKKRSNIAYQMSTKLCNFWTSHNSNRGKVLKRPKKLFLALTYNLTISFTKKIYYEESLFIKFYTNFFSSFLRDAYFTWNIEKFSKNNVFRSFSVAYCSRKLVNRSFKDHWKEIF